MATNGNNLLPALDAEYPTPRGYLQYSLGRMGRPISAAFLGIGGYGTDAAPNGLARNGHGHRGLRVRVLVGKLRSDAALAHCSGGRAGKTIRACRFLDELRYGFSPLWFFLHPHYERFHLVGSLRVDSVACT